MKTLILSDQIKTKHRLAKAIEKKRIQLMKITEKVTMLQIALDRIKHEYDVRIGKLILKDNQLDLEVIRLKNILHLLEKGIPYAQALKKIDQQFAPEIADMFERFETIKDEEALLEHTKTIAEDEQKKLKTLWKKILFAFHPDLVTDPIEKKKREEIMKRVNEAYSANDYEALKAIEHNHYADNPTSGSIETLEQVLAHLENAILAQKSQYQELRQSEWFFWKKKFAQAQKTGEDLFLELEKKLLDDIVSKFTMVNELKSQINQPEYL